MVRWAVRSGSSALPKTTTATPLGTRRSVTTPAGVRSRASRQTAGGIAPGPWRTLSTMARVLGSPAVAEPVEKRREADRRGPGHHDFEAHAGRAAYRSAAAARSRATPHAASSIVRLMTAAITSWTLAIANAAP